MTLKTFLRALATSAILVSTVAQAQTSSGVNQAFQVARQAVNPEMQTKVVSVYGIGTPDAIQKWYIIFYDPSVPSHGRAVQVENNTISKTYEAQPGKLVYEGKLTFDPSRITSETLALNATQGYAARHHLVYDSVRALLKQTSLSKPFCWRIELLDNGKSQGFVYVKALDDTVAYYVPPSSGNAASSTDKGSGFANDVKSTFLGIGGDLQEFFTGERTVDR
ncbi:MAG TPA: hypothetical protein VL981_05855 [Candidatus Methylacidiphilales bacterium]|nr:hypothetical protein [Candidatus Methylacidiphilales bacterium]